MKNSYITIALVIVALAGAGGVIWYFKGADPLATQTQEGVSQSADTVVATIRGGETKITRGELDVQIEQLAQNPQIQVPKEGDERIAFERLVLDQMVGNILFFEEAKRQGFTADDAAVSAELSKITGQYADTAAFEAALLGAKLDKESLKTNIARQLITNQYRNKIAAEHPSTTTPEEIKAFYDAQITPQNPDTALEAVTQDIQTYLEQQKVEEVITGIIADLRASADVKILI
ncbi:SurA N-terminal domain-containing protein [Candidatus Kaiserbacteria bacterium]|nr:SurA N-terminal domain-containing protein [Candidatus Kaiserbacteria bacterium]